MDLTLTSAERAFREEVIAFLATNLTAEMKERLLRTSSVFPDPDLSLEWHQRLRTKGWVAPSWPRDHGGPGWTSMQTFIFESECALAGAPILYPIGIKLVGPVVMRFGTERQKREWLPRILTREDYWCQGFSEPGAGSDLASLKTRAVRDGDHYVVNGSKIWTTHAHHANRIITLVRTADTPRRQDGISMLGIDMALPGIEVRPIMTIAGDHEVNEVFFTDVRVPADDLVGPENDGWNCAKYLLEFERGASAVSSRMRWFANRIERALDYADATGLGIDPAIQDRVSDVMIDIDAFECLELTVMGNRPSGRNPGAVAAVLKLRAGRIKQQITELGVELAGERALRWPEHNASVLDALVSEHLNSRAATIFGGSGEVQLSLIAKNYAGA
jgi:acyl-CoA dehydrogenase